MNNKKKIINTLRNADKASVDKLLAEETKKNEIFAKIQHKANIERSEYADNVSGVEKYERRISMIRIASIAASAILVVGSIGGGAAYIMNNRKPVDSEPDPILSSTPTIIEQATEAATEAATNATKTSVSEATTETVKGSKTTIVTDGATEVETTSVTEETAKTEEETITDDNDPQYSIAKEDLIEKAKNYGGCANYFDKFSADYTVILNTRREFHTEPETCVGKVYLDEIAMTASATSDRYENDKCLSKALLAVMDNYYYDAEESWTETDYTNGGYIFLDTPDKYYYVKDQDTDKVFITPWGRGIEIDAYAPENWDITGERTENGRKIVSISGAIKGNNNYEGVYRELPYTIEVDAETGMILSYDEYDSDGNNTYSFKLTNYKFNDEAVEFKSAADMISEIENGGYSKR